MGEPGADAPGVFLFSEIVIVKPFGRIRKHISLPVFVLPLAALIEPDSDRPVGGVASDFVFLRMLIRAMGDESARVECQFNEVFAVFHIPDFQGLRRNLTDNFARRHVGIAVAVGVCGLDENGHGHVPYG